MKRFLVFAGDQYYPQGGWLDFIDDFHTLEAAEAFAKTHNSDWYQIVDTLVKEIVPS